MTKREKELAVRKMIDEEYDGKPYAVLFAVLLAFAVTIVGGTLGMLAIINHFMQ
ncbi:MAG: hypothetical protein ABFC18_03310 [Rikenellaceae bacterium]